MISVHQCFYMFLFKCYLTVPVFWWLAECFNCMAAIVVSALKWRSLLAKPAALVQTVVQPMGTRWHLSTFVIFSSSLIITLLLQKRTVKEWQGGRERRKQFLQNKTTELSQDHKDTQQELPFSQSKIHTRSCVVLQQQRRQQPEQARKLHFRETKKRKKKRDEEVAEEEVEEGRRWRHNGVYLCFCLLWRSVNKLNMRGRRKKRRTGKRRQMRQGHKGRQRSNNRKSNRKTGEMNNGVKPKWGKIRHKMQKN